MRTCKPAKFHWSITDLLSNLETSQVPAIGRIQDVLQHMKVRILSMTIANPIHTSELIFEIFCPMQWLSICRCIMQSKCSGLSTSIYSCPFLNKATVQRNTLSLHDWNQKFSLMTMTAQSQSQSHLLVPLYVWQVLRLKDSIAKFSSRIKNLTLRFIFNFGNQYLSASFKNDQNAIETQYLYFQNQNISAD